VTGIYSKEFLFIPHYFYFRRLKLLERPKDDLSVKIRVAALSVSVSPPPRGSLYSFSSAEVYTSKGGTQEFETLTNPSDKDRGLNVRNSA